MRCRKCGSELQPIQRWRYKCLGCGKKYHKSPINGMLISDDAMRGDRREER